MAAPDLSTTSTHRGSQSVLVLLFLLVLIARAQVTILASLYTSHKTRVTDFIPGLVDYKAFVPPLPMRDYKNEGVFTVEKLNKYIEEVKRTGAPVIIRNILFKQELDELNDDYFETTCNSLGKYIDNNLLEAHKNVMIKEALNISPVGGLYQALYPKCQYDLARRLLHAERDYSTYFISDDKTGSDNATALVVAKNFHTRMHAHPDVTVHFALRNRKKWVITHQDENYRMNMKYGRTIPMGTDLFINQTTHLKRWEFDTNPGDVMLIPPWGFHGLEYYDDTTTISFLIVVYNNDVFQSHPFMSTMYTGNLMLENWRSVLRIIRENMNDSSKIEPKIRETIKAVYAKHQ